MVKKFKLSSKIALSITVLSAVCLIALLIVINTFIRDMIVDEVRERFEYNNALMSRDIDDWLNRFRNYIDTKIIMAETIPREELVDIPFAFLEANEDIAISFFSFTDEGNAISSVYGGLPDEWELFTRPWYVAAVENPGQIAVQNPFWSIVEQTWSTSISRTVTYLDGSEGVVSFTIRLDAVFEMMEDFAIEGGGFVFLIGENAVIIYHPLVAYAPDDSLLHLADFQNYGEILPAIMAGEDFIPFITEDGTHTYVLSMPLGASDWLMVSVVNASNINSIVNRLTTVVMITASIALIVLSILVLAYVSRLMKAAIARSVTTFRESSAALAHGEALKANTVRDDSFGLNEICEEFDQNLNIMASVVEDLSRFSHELGVNGDIEYRIDAEKYSGSFKEVIQSINDFADKFVGVINHSTRQMEQIEVFDANNQAKSRFLASMSHEIRTPMNAILGITEIQLRDSALDDNIREALEKIYVSGDMLLGIINDILDLSKIESGKMELVVEKYEIASLVNDTIVLNMMRIEGKPIEFEVYVDETMPAYMYGDELRIKQILNNILSNAFKYTNEGKVEMSVGSEEDPLSSDRTILRIAISDTGQGMDEEQIDTLFDAYSRFNQEENQFTEGTGLGMSITANLIDMMDGRIDVESEPDIGSTFTVFLTQGLVDEQQIGKETADSLSKHHTNSRAQMKRVKITQEPMPYGKVLIVDDVDMNIYVARGLMAPYSLQIDSADSGFAAIEKVSYGNEYDIIFMDHMMPDMDGMETTMRLREMGYEKPIVALTANAVVGQSNIFLNNGFDDYISKPIDIRQLNLVLNRQLRDKQPKEVVEQARKMAEEKKQQEQLEQLQKGEIETEVEEDKPDTKTAELFIKEASRSLVILDEIMSKGLPFNDEDLRLYVINTHSLKSSLAIMKNMELSAIAMELEDMGQEANYDVIGAQTPAFFEELRAYVNELTLIVDSDSDDTAVEESEADKLLLHEKLLAIKAACDEFDETVVEETLRELNDKKWDKPAKELLKLIAEKLLHSDFDAIIETVDSFMVESASMQASAAETSDIYPDEYILSPEHRDAFYSEFAKSQKDFVANMRNAVETGNTKQAYFLAHTIKGLAGIINEQALADVAELAETAFEAGTLPMDTVELLIAEAENVLAKVAES